MKQIILLIALCVAIMACSKPATYYFSKYDSGFAQINESFEEYTYQQQNQDVKWSEQDIIELATTYAFADSYTIIRDVDCRYFEQWGVRSVAVCYDGEKPVIYHEIETRGNHHFIETLWKNTAYHYNTTVCEPREGVRCVVRAHVAID